MSGACTSYVSAEQEVVRGFSCPRPGGEAAAVFCCGFRDHKYCCDDPHSFFPYEHSYMWWLRYRPWPSPYLDPHCSLSSSPQPQPSSKCPPEHQQQSPALTVLMPTSSTLLPPETPSQLDFLILTPTII